MPEPRHTHMVLYDITEDARRTRIRKVLASWGAKFQFSVFSIRCTGRELERIRFEVTRELDTNAGDRLAFIRLCNGCAERVLLHGDPLEPFVLDRPCCYIV